MRDGDWLTGWGCATAAYASNIGAGNAGLAAERSARHAGASTLLINDRFAGTICATVGCMPSKLLIAAAEALRRVPIFAIRVDKPLADSRAVPERFGMSETSSSPRPRRMPSTACPPASWFVPGRVS